MLPDKNKLDELNNKFRITIDKFKNDIQEIINKLNDINSIIDSYLIYRMR